MRRNHRRKIFNYLFILFICITLSSMQSIQEVGVLGAPTSPFSPSSSEFDTIDSFDVHPESGRWNTTLDDSIEDRITESNFEILTTNNETSGAKGYEMNRNSRNPDGSLEWQMQASGSGNQTEFFRDQVGDECDFTEDDEDILAIGNTTVGFGSGLLEVITDNAAFGGVLYNGFGGTGSKLFDMEIYINTVFRIRSATNTVDMRFEFRNPVDPRPHFDFTVTPEWQTFTTTIPFGETDFDSEVYYFRVIKDSDETILTFYIDYIKIIGDYDFATHVEGEIEDTWDWEDSLEYWYDDFDNISDFNDGSLENFTLVSSDTIANVDGWLQITDDDTSAGIECTGQSIDSTVYKWLTFEFYSVTDATDGLFVKDDDNNLLYSDITARSADTKRLISINLDDDPDWTGTEAGFEIGFSNSVGAGNLDIRINMTFLYDVELGDLEGWTGLDREYVNPNGFLRGTMAAAAVDALILAGGKSIDTSIFKIFIVRLSTSDVTLDVTIQASLGGGPFITVGSKTDIDSTSQTEYTFDLSDDSDWSGTAVQFQLLFDEEDGTLDGDEIVYIDYILLTGEWDSSDSVIGLMNENHEPVLNITTHHESNNTARFEFELLDSSGEIAYYWYSDYYSDIQDQYIIGKCNFDVLLSKLEITITAENNTRIDRITFPNEFTISSGLTPALFQIGHAPKIFISSYTNAMSWQHVFIDWIKVSFQEREWNHYDIADDSDWLFASVKGHAIEDTIDDTDGFRITIPQLDQWKGELYIDSIQDANWDSGDKVNYSATLYAVDYDNGDLHNIFTVTLELHASAANQIVIDTHVIIDDTEYGQVVSSAPAFGVYGYVEFSMTLEEDRNHASLELQADSGEGDGVSTIFTFEIDLSDISSDSSQEFVLSLDASVDISSANLECALSVFSNFILERGESSGRDSPIVPKNTLPDGGEGGLFDWLFDGFKNIIISLGLLLAPLFVILGDIFKLIEGWLNTAAGVITNAIALIEGWLNTAIGFIQEWVESIILDFIAGAQDLVEAILLGLVVLLSDVWDVIVGLIFLVWDFLTLPDLLAIAAVGLDSIVEILLGAPAFILSVINDWILPLFILILCGYWLWLVFLAFAEEGFEPLAGLSNFVDRLMTVYELTILGVGPLPIPIALFFIPLTYFMIIVPSGSVFAIW